MESLSLSQTEMEIENERDIERKGSRHEEANSICSGRTSGRQEERFLMYSQERVRMSYISSV